MKHPCSKDCPNRRGATKTTNSCHSTCRKYKEYMSWKKKHDEEETRIKRGNADYYRTVKSWHR